MHLNFHQESFSRAYVHAVAAAAGFKYEDAACPDDDNVDVSISARGTFGVIRSPRVDVQVKCRLGEPEGDPIRYALRVDDHEGLRHDNFQNPRILVVVFVPHAPVAWTSRSERSLLLRYCGYWTCLQGAVTTDSRSSITVGLPRRNVFDVAGLTELMHRIGRREGL